MFSTLGYQESLPHQWEMCTNSCFFEHCEFGINHLAGGAGGARVRAGVFNCFEMFFPLLFQELLLVCAANPPSLTYSYLAVFLYFFLGGAFNEKTQKKRKDKRGKKISFAF